MTRKVRIRAVGAWSPLGGSWPATWRGLLAGRSALSRFDALGLGLPVPTPVAACEGLDRALRGDALLKGASLRLARAACREALASADARAPARLYCGTTHGESDILVGVVREDASVAGAHFRSLLLDSIPELLAREVGAGGVECSYSSCVSGSHALLAAWLDIRGGLCRNSLVVGSDALSSLGVAGFRRAGASSKTSCRPFQPDRDGTIVGEGAAAVLLQAESAAGEGGIGLLSFGVSCEAGHPTRPDAEGKGLETAVRKALDGARLAPSDIGAVYLHGTGTPSNDSSEALAYRRVFGASPPPATSLKAGLGHSMGAAGLMSCLAAVETVTTGLIPPTLLDGEGDAAGVNLVVGEARRLKVGRPVLVQVSAFGGNNVACVVGTDG